MAFVVKKDNPSEYQFVTDNIGDYVNKQQLNIEKYCITSNTITYAFVKNKILNYFGNFPYNGSSIGFGFVPTWGVCIDNKTKQRYFGFLPYGQQEFYVQKNNQNINHKTFVDINKSRKGIPMAYTTYINMNKAKYLTSLIKNTSNNESVIDDYENRYIILKGLFFTSFLIHIMILDKYNHINNILITSASSKTSIALAFMLKRSNLTRNINVIGLTSMKNIKFVKDKLSSIYDVVYTYDEIETIDIDNKSFGMVDMAGNRLVVDRIHEYFNGYIKFSSMVGLTHNKEWGGKLKRFKNIKPKVFIAPIYIMSAQKKFGDKLEDEMLKYWKLFVEFSKQWLVINKIYGNKNNIAEIYKKVLNGDFKPNDGLIICNDNNIYSKL